MKIQLKLEVRNAQRYLARKFLIAAYILDEEKIWDKM
jgi:hypothetical protein